MSETRVRNVDADTEQSERMTITQTIQNECPGLTNEKLYGNELLTVTGERRVIGEQVVPADYHYEFDAQQRTYYEVERMIDPVFGAPRKVTSVIENRHESGLSFIINAPNAVNVRELQNKVTENADKNTASRITFSPTYSSICDFIRLGDSITAISTPNTVENNVESKLRQGGVMPIEQARIMLSCSEDDESRAVTYADSEFKIVCEDVHDDLLEHAAENRTRREYVTQLIELTFHNSRNRR